MQKVHKTNVLTEEEIEEMTEEIVEVAELQNLAIESLKEKENKLVLSIILNNCKNVTA